MSYFDEPKKNTNVGLANKFVKVVVGLPTIVQVIDTDSTSKWQHWLKDSQGKNVSVKCSGKATCPVCHKNAKLGPDGYKSPNYVKLQKRFMVNVVNLTPVKRGADGEVYIPMRNADGKLVYPATDAKGNSLADVKPAPMNEVQILERGAELFAQLGQLDANVIDPKDPDPIDGKRLGLTHFPIQISATGEGRDMKVTAQPLVGSPLTINPDEYTEKKIDLNAGFTFTPDEVQAILDGVAVSDIVAARLAQDAQTKPDAKPDLNYDIEH